jgi:hypothetical protein
MAFATTSVDISHSWEIATVVGRAKDLLAPAAP